MIAGICCEYCIKQETNDCPVENASPWSRWNNFCSEYENDNGRTISSYMKIVKIIGEKNE